MSDISQIDAVKTLAEALARLSGVGGDVAEGLSAEQASTFCGVSRAKWHNLNSRGLCPAPIELGDRCPRWLRSELLAWLRHGAPARRVWAIVRDSAMRRAG